MRAADSRERFKDWRGARMPTPRTARLLVVLAFVVVGAVGLQLRWGVQAPEPHTLRIGIGADPNQLDPAQSSAFVDRVVFAAMCDKLVDVGPDLQFQPELATRWEWSPDGRALTLTLRFRLTRSLQDVRKTRV